MPPAPRPHAQLRRTPAGTNGRLVERTLLTKPSPSPTRHPPAYAFIVAASTVGFAAGKAQYGINIDVGNYGRYGSYGGGRQASFIKKTSGTSSSCGAIASILWAVFERVPLRKWLACQKFE